MNGRDKKSEQAKLSREKLTPKKSAQDKRAKEKEAKEKSARTRFEQNKPGLEKSNSKKAIKEKSPKKKRLREEPAIDFTFENPQEIESDKEERKKSKKSKETDRPAKKRKTSSDDTKDVVKAKKRKKSAEEEDYGQQKKKRKINSDDTADSAIKLKNRKVIKELFSKIREEAENIGLHNKLCFSLAIPIATKKHYKRELNDIKTLKEECAKYEYKLVAFNIPSKSKKEKNQKPSKRYELFDITENYKFEMSFGKATKTMTLERDDNTQLSDFEPSDYKNWNINKLINLFEAIADQSRKTLKNGLHPNAFEKSVPYVTAIRLDRECTYLDFKRLCEYFECKISVYQYGVNNESLYYVLFNKKGDPIATSIKQNKRGILIPNYPGYEEYQKSLVESQAQAQTNKSGIDEFQLIDERDPEKLFTKIIEFANQMPGYVNPFLLATSTVTRRLLNEELTLIKLNERFDQYHYQIKAYLGQYKDGRSYYRYELLNKDSNQVVISYGKKIQTVVEIEDLSLLYRDMPNKSDSEDREKIKKVFGQIKIEANKEREKNHGRVDLFPKFIPSVTKNILGRELKDIKALQEECEKCQLKFMVFNIPTRSKSKNEKNKNPNKRYELLDATNNYDVIASFGKTSQTMTLDRGDAPPLASFNANDYKNLKIETIIAMFRAIIAKTSKIKESTNKPKYPFESAVPYVAAIFLGRECSFLNFKDLCELHGLKIKVYQYQYHPTSAFTYRYELTDQNDKPLIPVFQIKNEKLIPNYIGNGQSQSDIQLENPIQNEDSGEEHENNFDDDQEAGNEEEDLFSSHLQEKHSELDVEYDFPEDLFQFESPDNSENETEGLFQFERPYLSKNPATLFHRSSTSSTRTTVTVENYFELENATDVNKTADNTRKKD